jgi:hypothetical protein
MTAPKLSTPICIFVTPDIRGISEFEGPYESISPRSFKQQFSPALEE